MCLFLVACQKQAMKEDKTETIQQAKTVLTKKTAGNFGDGNEVGFYHMHKMNDQTYLSYFDYQTKQEVLLCQKPECQHQDETCTAKIQDMLSYLYVYDEHLYLIENSVFSLNSLGEFEQTNPRIIQMNLDGSHRHVLYSVENGYHIKGSDLCFDNENIYISIYKKVDYEKTTSSHLTVNQDEALYQISLRSGKAKKLIDMNHKSLCGVEGRQLILYHLTYLEDPQKYLDKNDFEGYDRVVKKGQLSYDIVDIDTLETTTLKTESQEYGTYMKGKIYFQKQQYLYCLDIDTGKEEVLLKYPNQHYFSIRNVIGDYLIVEESDDDYIATYKISTNHPRLENINQVIQRTNEPMTILAQNQKHLLVIYDKTGHEEKTWAKTTQFEVDKEYIGYIEQVDFLNGKKNFVEMKQLKRGEQ